MNKTELARYFLTNNQATDDLAVFHLMQNRSGNFLEVPITSRHHLDLQAEKKKMVMMPARGFTTKEGGFIGMTMPQCVEDGKPNLVFWKKTTTEDMTATSSLQLSQEIAYDEYAWSQYRALNEGSEFILAVTETALDLRTNITLQDAFLGFMNTRKPDIKQAWLADQLEIRNDPEFTLAATARAAAVEIDEVDRERWDRLAVVHPAYKDAAALAVNKNLPAFSRGLKRLDELWSGVREERIAYAQINGVRLLERNANFTDEYKAVGKDAMLNGEVPMRAMKSMEGNINHEVHTFIYGKIIKAERKELIARTAGRF